mgnify:FL=1
MPRLTLFPTVFIALFILFPLTASGPESVVDPPFGGTIFLDPDIITESDPTVFQDISYTGQGQRTIFDRRTNNWEVINAFLFTITFSDGGTAEAQVNPEFGTSDNALVAATKYGVETGRMPKALRRDMDAIWINKGVQPFGGGNRSVLIHTGQSALYEADGILEETLVHELAHTSLDGDHALATGWVAAQTSDPEFISTYARDYPQREDVAESFLPYLAVRYRADRISTNLKNIIEQTIPARIAYFDNLGLDLDLISNGTENEPSGEVPQSISLDQNHPNPFFRSTTIPFTTAEPTQVRITVVDSTGKEIMLLDDRFRNAGSHEVSWNGQDVQGRTMPNGVYFYQISSPEGSITKSMVLVR